MRVVLSLCFAAMLFTPAPVRAGEEITKAAEHAMGVAFYYMGVAYLCQGALGSGHYHAARAAAEDLFTKVSGSSDKAVIAIDDFDKQIRKKHKVRSNSGDSQRCLDEVLEAQKDFRVAQARLSVALDEAK